MARFLSRLLSGSDSCQHVYMTMYDERFCLEDEKYHTFKVTACIKCGKIEEETKIN